MWERAILLLGLFSHLAFIRGAESNPAVVKLRRELSEHVGQKKFAEANWGIKVMSLDSGVVLFETNAHKLLKPASNAKVFTGALALDVLGPDYRIRTSLLAKGLPDANGTVAGDLVVLGRGDPAFSARFQEGLYTNVLGRVVEALKRAGVRRIEGDLVGDETYFQGPRWGASWTWDDLNYYYGAEVSALSIQDNVVDLFVRPGPKVGTACEVKTKPEGVFGKAEMAAANRGFSSEVLEIVNRTRTTETNMAPSVKIFRAPGERRVYLDGTLPKNHGVHVDAVTVPNPAMWFVITLREALLRAGISVGGTLRVRSWPQDQRINLAEWREVAFTESPPLSEILEKMLKPSQNLYAQLLLLQAGSRKGGAGSSEEIGLKEMRAFLKRIRIDPEEVLLDEGSGLSRSALATPNALVSLLQHMAKHPHAKLFRSALPGPGEGTLRNRLQDLKQANLQAKTGSVRYVSTLSGYVRSKAGEQLVFAIILNGYDNNNAPGARDEVEAVLRLLL